MTRRLLAYFDARPGAPRGDDDGDAGPSLAVWPEGAACGTAASWLGTTGPIRGLARSIGGLLLITGIESNVAEFIAWMRKSAPVARALSRLYWFEGGIPAADSDAASKFAWPAPGTGGCPLPRAESVDDLAATLLTLHGAAPRPPLRIMAAPRSLQTQIMDKLDSLGWPMHPTAADACLAAVDAGDGRGIRAALVPRTAVLADTTPEKERGDAPSRAAAKLTEAAEVLGVHLGDVTAAIDVGAAPGGWTAVLADAGVRCVVALDPADLGAAVLARPAVTHIRSLSEADGAVDAIRAALVRSTGVETADLLLCDANAAPGQTARALRPVIPLLRPGGLALVTLKCAHAGSPWGDGKALAARVVREKLGPGLKLVTTLWLMANTLCERTLVLVRPGEGASLLNEA